MNLKTELYKFLGIFIISFVGLYLLTSNAKGLQKSMASVNASLGEAVFNTINPDLSVEFRPGAPPNPKGFDFTILIYDDRTAKKEPTTGVYQNHFLLFAIPFILLTSLFLATPIDWKPKLFRYPIALLLLYIFIVFLLSYRFELVLTQDNYQVTSVWTFLTMIFGLGGTIDNIYIVVVMIWIILLGWSLFKKFTTD